MQDLNQNLNQNYEVKDPNLSQLSQKVFPWRRFFARGIDYGIFSIVCLIIYSLFFPFGNGFANLLFAVFVTFVWTFIEAYLISHCKTTIGKWLYNLQVTKKTGENLNYNEAYSRSFKVWVRGVAFGLPLISYITALVQYFKYKKNLQTSWDADVKSKITSEKIEGYKIGLIVLAFIIIAILPSAITVAIDNHRNDRVSNSKQID